MFVVELILGVAGLGWLAYNLYRVMTEPRQAVEVGAQVVTHCPRPFAFQTYMKVREYYLQLSDGHRLYEMKGTHLTRDMVIDVWETAGFQYVKHRYRVIELVPNERMRLLSEHSGVRVLGMFKGQSRSEVEFRFDDCTPHATALGLTIRSAGPSGLHRSDMGDPCAPGDDSTGQDHRTAPARADERCGGAGLTPTHEHA